MSILSAGFGTSFSFASRPFRITSVTQLPNLEIGYNGASGASGNFNSGAITSGTEITSWHNTGSVSSRDWNTGGGTKPEWFSNIQNGLGAVRFNGSSLNTPTGEDADTDENLTINPVSWIQSLSGATMVIVFRSLSTAAGARYCCSTDVGGFQWGISGTQWVGGFAGASFTVDTIVADTNFHHIILNFDGTQTGDANRLKLRLDGSAVTFTVTSGSVGSATSGVSKYFYGGATGTTSNNQSNFWIGDIGELLIWTRHLNVGEILAIEDYLSGKWGI